MHMNIFLIELLTDTQPGCLGADTFNYHNLWVAYWINCSKITNLLRWLSDNGQKNLELDTHVWLGFPERYKILSSTQSTGTALCSSSSPAVLTRWRGFSETKKGFSRSKSLRLITAKIKHLRKLYTLSETPLPLWDVRNDQYAFVHALKLKLKPKRARKLWSVIKWPKIQLYVLTLTYLLFFYSALSFCFCITTSKTVGKNIDQRRLTSIFTCELKAIYEAQAVSFTLTSVQISCLSLTYCLLT